MIFSVAFHLSTITENVSLIFLVLSERVLLKV